MLQRLFAACSLVLLVACADATPRHMGGPSSFSLNGSQPIKLRLTPKLQAWAAQRGAPTGATLSLLQQALPWAESLWYPYATGPVQAVDVDLDDAPGGHCASRRGDGSPLYSAWTQPGYHVIYFCPAWPYATQPTAPGLDGLRGAQWTLSHELGHQLGGGHVLQLGRATGPIMCGWASNCLDPLVQNYTAEDQEEICRAGRGGRCPLGLPGGEDDPPSEEVILEPR